MSKENPHNNFIVSLDSFIKYVKGNLLGDKKKEVDLHLNNSPLFQDAAEGLGSFKKPDKLPETVDELNKRIALKIGTTASQAPSPKAASGTKVVSLNLKAIATISAAASVIVACGLGIYFGVKALNEDSKTAQVAVAEMTDEASKPKEDLDFRSFDELQRQDSVLAEADSTRSTNGADTIAVNLYDLADADNASIQEDEGTPDPGLTYDWSFGNQPTGNASKENSGTYEVEITQQNGAQVSKALKNESKLEAEEESIPDEKNLTEPESYYSGNAESLNNASFSKKNEQITAYSSTSTDSAKLYEAKDKKSRYRDKDKEELPEPYETAVEFLKKGDTESAQKEFEKVLNNKKSPFYDDAAWQLANIYLQQGESKKAKKMLKKVDGTTKYGEKAKKLLENL